MNRPPKRRGFSIQVKTRRVKVDRGRTIWFTSDTHFGHAGVLRLSNRPFRSLDEMHEELVRRWNERVHPNDVVFHLGDLMFGRPLEALRELKGRVTMLAGNHDQRRSLEYADALGWDLQAMFNIKVADDAGLGPSPKHQYITLCHYPMVTWNYRRFESWMLHGHSHGTRDHENRYVKRLDVGVDCFNYAPVSYEQVREIMRAKPSYAQRPNPDADPEDT